MARSAERCNDRLGGGVVRGIELGPPVRRGDRFERWRGRRALVGRLAALAVVSAVLLLPQTSSAGPGLIDTTPPVIASSIDGIAGTNNWFRGSSRGNFVVVHWTVTDPESPIISSTGCEPAIRIDGPNNGTTRSCSATSDGGTDTK